MNKLAAIVSVALAIALCGCSMFQKESKEHRTKTVKLFNGKDLNGWTSYFKDSNTKMEDVFTVQDGVIHDKGSPAGYIRTMKDYTNYRLSLEWRFIKKGNSGVLLRVQPPDKVWPQGLEAQLNSGDAGDIWVIDNYPAKTDPSRTEGRRTKKMNASNEKPIGEWNVYEIKVEGTSVELKVNGMLQNTATDVKEQPGKIALQAEGAVIEFRNIELTELP